MKNNFLKTTLFTLLTFYTAGHVFAQETSLTDFNEISIADNIEVIITQSSTQS